MLFKPEHIDMIWDGKKTMTRRIWRRCMVKVGNTYKCKTQMLSKEFFAVIKVNKVYKQLLRDMTDEDARKEGYKDMEDFKGIWTRINGKDSWNDNLEVYVIEFERAK